ncbi:efflux RND transporter periplasmic adaptor subunit [Aquimarina sp. U1-2]|uniref:efflux RND transporter periplasmic adaptor subunit n=1 Tax=Aquimarina sp. U1-2 TaxID=2823141 RepID=UPI001AECC50F|nr:efflux RND transporter periplasmic adaptor subunit [Aquimarina sp. U1-2]MBP2831036.1 efflux RND transporter periplasmic adaptor subunit [Aquimarina sp. U1-2]
MKQCNLHLKPHNSFVFAIVLLTVFLIFNGCKEKDEKQEQALLEAKVCKPKAEKITEWDEYTGRFEATDFVEVRARVSGYIDHVNFTDGQTVKKGDVLFIIDQRPFLIALQQAKAAFGEANANLKQAQDNFTRVESLRESGAVSIEEYDRRQQGRARSQASLQLAQARVDEAKLNLEFTKVRAPISGRISRDLVNEGNLINGGTANSTILTTIVSTDPIYFYFTGSEADFLKYSRLDQKGERNSSREEANPVFIRLQDEKEYAHEGKMNFVDNQIDQNTGTIEARAILDNKDGLLEPGMFGRARLLGSAEHQAIMIPDEIIGTNQSVRYVYTVNDANEVSVTNVELGPLHTNGLRIVRNGLKANDKIVTSNIQKIRPGITISPVEGQIVAVNE